MINQNFMRDVWQHIRQSDWDKAEYDNKKAVVCAAFSKLAYLAIPEFELADASGVKVIPCADHQDLILKRKKIDFDELFMRGEFGKQFVIYRRNVVVLGVVTPHVIFIAIRGTRPLYLSDWMIDFKTYPRKSAKYSPYFYHRGFYNEISRSVPQIVQELDRFGAYKNRDIPIYVTGHSLGGAMAGILYSHFGLPFRRKPSTTYLHPKAAYTYGMPRYGNLEAMLETPNPFHIFNQKDIFPSVPPKWMGFANPLLERSLDGHSMENITQRDTHSLLKVWSAKSWRQGVKEHSIDLYLDRLKQQL